VEVMATRMIITVGIGKVVGKEAADGRTDAVAILVPVVETEETIPEVVLQAVTAMVDADRDEVVVARREDDLAEAIRRVAGAVKAVVGAVKAVEEETTVARTDIKLHICEGTSRTRFIDFSMLICLSK
jgi:ABC-type nitrate/sulfonate/bicarbonate transport system substrate-binding protein